MLLILVRRLLKSQPQQVFWLIVLALAISFIEILGVVAIGQIVSYYSGEDSVVVLIAEAVTGHMLLFLMCSFYLIRASFLFIFYRLLGTRLYDLKTSIVFRYLKCNLRLTELPGVDGAEFDTAISTDAQICSEKFLRPVVMSFVEACVFVGIIVVLVISNPLLTLGLAVGVCVFALIARGVFAPILRNVGSDRKRFEIDSFNALQSIVANKNDYYRLAEIDPVLSQFRATLVARFGAEAVNFIYGKYPKVVLESGAFIGILLVGFAISTRAVDIGLGTLAIFSFAVFRLIPSVTKIASNVNDIIFASSSMEKLLLSDPIETKRPVVNVSGFSVAEAPFLQGPLQVAMGRHVAIVGPSGVGKTFFTEKLFSWDESFEKHFFSLDCPSSCSSLRLGDIDFGKSIAIYNKRSALIVGSIAENIALSKHVDMEKVNELKLVCSIDFLHNDTERNILNCNLSDGQIQRILVARALYGNNGIVILDEPTSALDKENAETLLRNLSKIKDKGILLITHDTLLLGGLWDVVEIGK